MAVVILPADDLKAIIRDRRRRGGDRYDEVWNGVYVMSPLADNEHQHVGFELASAIKSGLSDPETQIFHGANLSNNPENWRKNYRCPDVAVFLPGNTALDRGSHWLGGPEFAVEVMSKGDRSRKKVDFYRDVGVKELLLVSRKPWKLELHRVYGQDWSLVGGFKSRQSQLAAERGPRLEFSAHDRTETAENRSHSHNRRRALVRLIPEG